MNRCVEQMHRYVEMSPHYPLLVYYLQLNSVFLTNPHLITWILRYLCNSRFQFCLNSSEQILRPDYLFVSFSDVCARRTSPVFFLEILGSYFVDDSELLGAAFLCVSPETPLYTVLVFKNAILQQRFCFHTAK